MNQYISPNDLKRVKSSPPTPQIKPSLQGKPMLEKRVDSDLSALNMNNDDVIKLEMIGEEQNEEEEKSFTNVVRSKSFNNEARSPYINTNFSRNLDNFNQVQTALPLFGKSKGLNPIMKVSRQRSTSGEAMLRKSGHRSVVSDHKKERKKYSSG